MIFNVHQVPTKTGASSRGNSCGASVDVFTWYKTCFGCFVVNN